ncbi:MAG: DUF3370 domain-containing protein [Cyanothece sp. SIO2G6]|nr:DUF3370 domain-containing protein [Cyanothece sp. SIO2G6]
MTRVTSDRPSPHHSFPPHLISRGDTDVISTNALSTNAISANAISANAIVTNRIQTQAVRSLPGRLDTVPVFNSNSPELVQQEGILLSTFPPNTMAVPSAHLNYAFDGRFDVFAHHVARGLTHDDIRTMYLGIMVHNPNASPVVLNMAQAATYLSQEAPFYDLPPYVANPLGTVFSGPGSRVMGDILRGVRQPHWPETITIPSQHSHLLMNVPIPLRRLSVPVNGTLASGQLLLPPLPTLEEEEETEDESVASASLGEGLVVNSLAANRPLPTNGRTVLMRMYSSGPVYIASLAMYAPMASDHYERVPTIYEWADLLTKRGLAGPRDYPPTPPDAEQFSRFFYGRVAGVAQGSQWNAALTDGPNSDDLTIPDVGRQISYVLSSLDHNTFGTGQIQSGQILKRYPDTAYRAHGNYGVLYNLSLPLYNNTNREQEIDLKIETPIQDESQPNMLTFLDPPEDRIFFRGTVLVRYVDNWNLPQARYFHLVQRRGQQGKSLVRLRLQPGERRPLKVELLYPPDATPPQVVTVETVDLNRNLNRNLNR